MTLFLISIAILILGYFTYGFFIEKVLKINPKAITPACAMTDGVDYLPMPTWKVFLIQFLNIAGIGPIFGAIMGIQYGPSAFLWIVFGTIFGGAVHDFVSAMISIRTGGQSLPNIVGSELGKGIKSVMTFFTLFLLIMVIAVFVRTPAALLAGMTPETLNLQFWAVAIFAYYILATLLPIDKLIGNLYPIFGASLLFMAVGITAYLIFGDVSIPVGLENGFGDRMADTDANPIFPMMFVSIACGAISGFHATQSPMMARCIKNERHGRFVFYGAMVTEGIVALIWAAAAIAFAGGYSELTSFLAAHDKDAGSVVSAICNNWLGTFGGILAILGVIAAPITTGDTAMRSARLIVAEMFNIKQQKLLLRFLVALPLIVLTFVLLQIDFSILWRYFGWGNQSLSIFTLWACTVYLARHGRNYFVTLIPAIFMTMVCITYICYAPLGEYRAGVGLSLETSTIVAAIVSIVFLGFFIKYVKGLKSTDLKPMNKL